MSEAADLQQIVLVIEVVLHNPGSTQANIKQAVRLFFPYDFAPIPSCLIWPRFALV